MNSSCKKWLDVNKDPNDLEFEKGKVEFALTSSEYTIAYVVGNRYQEIGGFLSQYWTQLPSATQYYDYDKYSFDGADANREWAQMYAGALRDLNYIVSKAGTDGDSNYVAIAKILQAYSYQLVTDVHGDVPFSEALKAQDGIISPKYDNQELIYDGCLVLLNDAIAYLDNNDAVVPAKDDVIFNGDMTMWYKFANSLKMKLAIRQSKVRPATTAAILATVNSADCLASGENAMIHFYDVIGNKNPLYTSIQGVGVDNNIASKAIADSLNAWGDLRATYFFDEESFGAAGINGTQQGAAAFGGYPSNAARSSLAKTIVGATVPVILMSASESYFLQAEANLLAGATTDAQVSYEEGVVESMTYCGIDTTGLDLFSAEPYMWSANPTMNKQQIAVQKWVSMCGLQNMESWIELRRTGYPALNPSKATVLGTGLFPMRIPYSQDEETANSNFPGQKAITDRMWWNL